MKLFLFEFATCGEKIEDSIAVEGLAMFKAAYDGFKNYYDIHGFVRDEYSSFFDLPSGDVTMLEDYLSESDAFLIVAPEDDNLLLELTKLGEKYAENLGSSSKAISVVSDKWKLYKKLKGSAQIPETSKKPLNGKFIIKPRISCAGEGISFGSDSVPDGYIAQEFIEGKNMSVSVIAKDGECRAVSVNEQLLDGFKYAGAIVPARVSEKIARDVEREALKAAECIEGINGYVGVDIVYSDQPYVIEINARLTTPVSAFERAYGVSIADMLVGKSPKFARRQMIRKGTGLAEYYVKSGMWCLQVCNL